MISKKNELSLKKEAYINIKTEKKIQTNNKNNTVCFCVYVLSTNVLIEDVIFTSLIEDGTAI